MFKKSNMMPSIHPNSSIEAPIPDRAYEGILASKRGETLGQYVQPAKKRMSLRKPIHVASATRQKRKSGGHVLHELHGGKAHTRMDRPGKCASKEVVKEMIHKHEKHEHPGEGLTHLKEGGRMHRKRGGATKGKTNINIILGTPMGGAPNAGPMNPPMSPPMAPPQMAPRPQMPPPMQAPMGGPAGMPPQMNPMGMPPVPRRFGGRLGKSPMTAGAESGEGRLQKEKWYGGNTMGSKFK